MLDLNAKMVIVRPVLAEQRAGGLRLKNGTTFPLQNGFIIRIRKSSFLDQWEHITPSPSNHTSAPNHDTNVYLIRLIPSPQTKGTLLSQDGTCFPFQQLHSHRPFWIPSTVCSQGISTYLHYEVLDTQNVMSKTCNVRWDSRRNSQLCHLTCAPLSIQLSSLGVRFLVCKIGMNTLIEILTGLPKRLNRLG